MELREKLRLALAAAPVRSAASLQRPLACPSRDTRSLDGLPLRSYATVLGEVHVAEETWPLSHRHGHFSLGGALDVGETALERIAPGISPSDLGRLAFLDVETTGLAGGTGTLAFLVGVATFEDGGLRLRQFFLANPGGEEALLAELGNVLDGCAAVVTFNGRCFDAPLLDSRFVLGRLRSPFGGMGHVDLLHPARRLHGHHLDSCRLGEVERSVLGVRRTGDLPGWAVPKVYFDYLRTGTTAALAEVFMHNRLDILSLVTLLAHVGDVAGSASHDDAHVCLALARWDEARGQHREAADLYHAALLSNRLGDEHLFAMRGILSALRRLGDRGALERVLVEMLAVDVPARIRVLALVELAKIREHRCRDYASAEALTREAMTLSKVAAVSRAPQTAPGALERRLDRLLLRRQGSGSTLSADTVR